MSNILDRFVRSSVEFQPQTARHYLALQLSRKLRDPDHVYKYVHLVDSWPVDLIIQAFHRAQKRTDREPLTRFRSALEELTHSQE